MFTVLGTGAGPKAAPLQAAIPRTRLKANRRNPGAAIARNVDLIIALTTGLFGCEGEKLRANGEQRGEWFHCGNGRVWWFMRELAGGCDPRDGSAEAIAIEFLMEFISA